MARFEEDSALVAAIREGVRAVRETFSERGDYDGHDLINWLSEHRNDELYAIYELYGDCADPEMTADQQLGRFLYAFGQKKVGARQSARRITGPSGRDRNGICSVSVWSITEETHLGNPNDRFASVEEREEYEADEREQKAFHKAAFAAFSRRIKEDL